MKFMIRPILDESDYEAALTEIEELMDAEPGTREGARLDVLSTLVDAYEAKHWRIEPPNPLDAIRARMEERGLRNVDLEPMIGSRGRVSEVLSGKRPLTLPMIRRLSAGLGLSADILIREGAANHRRSAPGPRKRRTA